MVWRRGSLLSMPALSRLVESFFSACIWCNIKDYDDDGDDNENKKLISRWDSERELSLRRRRTRSLLWNTIDEFTFAKNQWTDEVVCFWFLCIKIVACRQLSYSLTWHLNWRPLHTDRYHHEGRDYNSWACGCCLNPSTFNMKLLKPLPSTIVYLFTARHRCLQVPLPPRPCIRIAPFQ